MKIHSGFHFTAITIFIWCSLNIVIKPPLALAKPADNYIGVGTRGGLKDDQVGIVNAKFKIIDLGGVSFSARPAVFLGDYKELRLSLTGEKEVMPGWSPFLGGGLATNTDRSGELNFMLAGGLDFQINERFVLQIGGNYIFQSNDTDAEMTVSINYSF